MPIYKLFFYAAAGAQGRGGDILVQIDLHPEHSLAAAYPVSRCSLQHSVWHISANSSGDLLELEMGKSEVSYLFYETL